MSAGITAKIGRFNVNAATKAILGEPKSTIDFEDIMDSEKFSSVIFRREYWVKTYLSCLA